MARPTSGSGHFPGTACKSVLEDVSLLTCLEYVYEPRMSGERRRRIEQVCFN